MGKMTREEKLFRNETRTLNYYQDLVAAEDSGHVTKETLTNLTDKYRNLLDQTRFLTWISGRLERKLHRTNRELFEKNNRLESTLQELTKARAGRSAYAIIYFIAIALFVLEEYFVEPFINIFGDNAGYGIIVKLSIVLLLKVSEGFIERKITTRQRKVRDQVRPALSTTTPQ